MKTEIILEGNLEGRNGFYKILEALNACKELKECKVIEMKGNCPDPSLSYLHMIPFNYPTMSEPTLLLIIALYGSQEVACIITGIAYEAVSSELFKEVNITERNFSGMHGVILSMKEFVKVAPCLLYKLGILSMCKGRFGMTERVNFSTEAVRKFI